MNKFRKILVQAGKGYVYLDANATEIRSDRRPDAIAITTQGIELRFYFAKMPSLKQGKRIWIDRCFGKAYDYAIAHELSFVKVDGSKFKKDKKKDDISRSQQTLFN